MTRKLAIGAAAASLLVAAMFLLPVRAWAVELVQWIREQGPLAALGFAGIYVLASVVMVPASALTLGAGFAYGPVWGTVLVAPAALLASTIAFLIARRFGRSWLAARLARDRRFTALDRAIAREGFKITVLVRLSPLFPYGLTNYALGFTDVQLRAYVVGSAIGMLPGTILYVYLGSLLTTAAELAARPQGSGATALYWGGLAVAVVVTVVITVLARRALRAELGASVVGTP
ncbi:MAG: TVP38/TMEM64 family protein [Myxococcota bacterium]|nr:TVP38/TMEM64 family protein [Myxococcota bacterium]